MAMIALSDMVQVAPEHLAAGDVRRAEGKEITKEQWGKLIDAAPDKWKRCFERATKRRIEATTAR